MSIGIARGPSPSLAESERPELEKTDWVETAKRVWDVVKFAAVPVVAVLSLAGVVCMMAGSGGGMMIVGLVALPFFALGCLALRDMSKA